MMLIMKQIHCWMMIFLGKWIVKYFGPLLFGLRESRVTSTDKRTYVMNVLKEMRLYFHEAPFIWQNRKELLRLPAVDKELEEMEKDVPQMETEEEEEEERNSRIEIRTEITRRRVWNVFDAHKMWYYLALEKKGTREKIRSILKEEQAEEMLEWLERTAVDIPSVNDVRQYCLLRSVRNSVEQGNAPHEQAGFSHRLPGSYSLYGSYLRTAVKDFISFFGLTSDEFAENLARDTAVNTVRDPAVTPIVAAESRREFWINDFNDEEAFLSTCRRVLAEEIAVEPAVRAEVRKIFWQNAVVDVKWTLKGRQQIDSTHKLAKVRDLRGVEATTWLRVSNDLYSSNGDLVWTDVIIDYSRFIDDEIDTKPVTDANVIMMLLLAAKGAQDGLLDLKVVVSKLDDVVEKTVKNSLSGDTLFLSENEGDIAEAWNVERKKILDMVVRRVFQSLGSEVLGLMVRAAKEIVGYYMRLSLAENVSLRYPKIFVTVEDETDTVSKFRVCAIIEQNRDGNTPTTLVTLDENGDVVDHTTIHEDRWRNGIVGETDDMRTVWKRREQEFKDQFEEFCIRTDPVVVAIGADSLGVLKLKNVVDDVLLKRMDAPAFIVPCEVARIFMNSGRAAKEFPEYSMSLKKAISVGRYLQDPLEQYCGLWNEDNDMLSLPLFDYKDSLSEKEFSSAVERTLVDKVSEVCVDLKRVANWPFAASGVVQFLSGMGKRRAAQFLRAYGSRDDDDRFDASEDVSGGVESRRDLLRNGYLGPHCYENCAGFVLVSGSQEYEDLDISRIHPESYCLAAAIALGQKRLQGLPEEVNPIVLYRKMQKETYDIESLSAEQEAAIADHIDDIKAEFLEPRHAAQMIEKSLDEIAKSFSKPETIVDIAKEFLSRRSESRIAYQNPKNYDLFWILSGEDKDRLTEGALLSFMVNRIHELDPSDDMQQDRREMNLRIVVDGCIPDNNVRVFASLDDVDEGFDYNDHIGSLSSLNIRVGHECSGIVKRVLVDRPPFGVRVSLKEEDVKRVQSEQEQYEREFYNAEGEVPEAQKLARQELDRMDAENRKRESSGRAKRESKKLQHRQINHPLFRNWGYHETIEFLKNKQPGETVIRPSSRGVMYINFTVRFFNGTTFNVVVKELEKNEHQMLALGRKLKVEGREEEYADLDEVFARVVDEYVRLGEQVRNHRNFFEISAEDSEGRRRPDDVIEREIQEELDRKRDDRPRHVPYCLTYARTRPLRFRICYQPEAHGAVAEMGFSVTPDGFKFRDHVRLTIDEVVRDFKELFVRAVRKAIQPLGIMGHMGGGFR